MALPFLLCCWIPPDSLLSHGSQFFAKHTVHPVNGYCFLYEALTCWGYAARQCIIDNTNLARLRGTGAQAVLVAEMEVFAQQFAFQFVCHEKGHPDRKENVSYYTS